MAYPDLAASDRIEIQQLWAHYGEAVSRSDAAAIARLYALDGDMIAIDGQVASGPEAIEAFYRRQLDGAYQGVSMTDVELGDPRSVTENVALMNGTWLVHGIGAEPFRVRTTFVTRREAAGWRYVAVRFAAALQTQRR